MNNHYKTKRKLSLNILPFFSPIFSSIAQDKVTSFNNKNHKHKYIINILKMMMMIISMDAYQMSFKKWAIFLMSFQFSYNFWIINRKKKNIFDVVLYYVFFIQFHSKFVCMFYSRTSKETIECTPEMEEQPTRTKTKAKNSYDFKIQ